MFEIRRLRTDDWQLLKSTRLEALADTPYAFGSTHAEELKFDEVEWRSRCTRLAWFVTVQDEEGVGLAAGASFSVHPARDLIAMRVRSDVRGAGAAAELVNAVADWARLDGGSELLLWVADGNDPAMRFYQRMGFVLTGKRDKLRSNPLIGEDQLRLSL